MSGLRALHDAAGARWTSPGAGHAGPGHGDPGHADAHHGDVGGDAVGAEAAAARDATMAADDEAAADRDAVVVAHVRNYGDPAAEYEAARGDAAIAERSDRSFVRVHGRDPVRMIQGLISNDVANATADRAVYATALTPKGKMVADMRVVRHGAELLLETDSGAAPGLMAHLRKFVPPLFAKFEDANAAWGEIGVYGPRARVVVGEVFGIDVSDDVAADDLIAATLDATQVMIVATSDFGVPGFDLLVPAELLERAWRALASAGARPVGHATLDVLRIEAGRPRWGAELTETTIPLEAGLRERAISETKGCYTGQEVIIRILHRGHVNWILRRLLLGDAPAPAPETVLVSPGEGKKVGRITSAAWSPRYGQTIGLGYVRREVEPGGELRLGDVDGRRVRVADAAEPADAEPTS